MTGRLNVLFGKEVPVLNDRKIISAIAAGDDIPKSMILTKENYRHGFLSLQGRKRLTAIAGSAEKGKYPWKNHP